MQFSVEDILPILSLAIRFLNCHLMKTHLPVTLNPIMKRNIFEIFSVLWHFNGKSHFLFFHAEEKEENILNLILIKFISDAVDDTYSSEQFAERCPGTIETLFSLQSETWWFDMMTRQNIASGG